MDETPAANRTGVRFRRAIDFAVDGDIRFISHNDSVRMFSRALARAKLPVHFTGKFNPRPRVSLPFPRPVGQASDAERILVDLTEAVPETDLLEQLHDQMPEGILLKRAVALDPNDSCQPKWVRYSVDLVPENPSRVRQRAEALLSSPSVPVVRKRHKDQKIRTVDIRPLIDRICIASDSVIVDVFVTPDGSASPLEICNALGIVADVGQHQVRRLEIRWQENPPTRPTSSAVM